MSAKKTRIMYMECRAETLNGAARIGRVTFSKSGRSLSYGGKTFVNIGGAGFKANFMDEETCEQYWISGPRKDGDDRLYKSNVAVEIDDDVADEYWRDVRGLKR